LGKRGASKLINEFGTLEKIYENIDNAGTPRIQKLLMEAKEKAFMSRELVTMKDDIFKDFDLDRFIFEDKNYLACLMDEFKKYEMKQAMKSAMKDDSNYVSIVQEESKPSISFQHHTLHTIEALNSAIDAIPSDAIVAFDTETTGLDTKSASIVGFSFSYDDNNGYYVPIAHNYLGVEEQVELSDALSAIQKLFESYKIVGQNLKYDLSLLYNRYDFAHYTPYGDSMILAWLYDSSMKVGLDALAKRYFYYDMKPFKELVKKGEDFSSVDIENASFYASEDAWMTRKVYLYLENLLKEEELEHLMDEAKAIEYPFINILASMEQKGIKLDLAKLRELEVKLNDKLAALTASIYAHAGSEFNIKSTQQLGVILFETLGLEGSKKTKTGYSTNEQVLNSLMDAHPIIPEILEYREHQKILSTYVKPLTKLAKSDANNRVYTSFIQTGTATGRLSSKDPNLQNIPVRSALGREVREAFVAKEGYKLVGIDYSQIELRLLAHFSQDKALVQAFKDGVDIHLATATKLFGEEEAQAKRSFAKSINFGLLYGMGSRKLADELKISTKEAKEIIENYFRAFPTIESFLDGIKEDVKVDGYIETIEKRRRVFDYANANGMQKASFERESTNTLFQGSAADLIKLSMIAIDKIIEEESLDANMLLQIHDELIFEIKEEKAEELGQKFASIMENIKELNIPLECSISIGDSWGELK
jgi:DNA polymerase-1